MNPPLIDLQHTTWAFDETSETLFASEGLGHYHSEGGCTALWNEIEAGITAENIREFHEDRLV